MIRHLTCDERERGESGLVESAPAGSIDDLVQKALSFNGGRESAEFARAFCLAATRAFWTTRCRGRGYRISQPEPPARVARLTTEADSYARELGMLAGGLPLAIGAYTLSSLYVQALPGVLRTQYGMYFTPPPVVDRLLDMVTGCGFDWRQGAVIDPACGGGAFLAPVASRMLGCEDVPKSRAGKAALLRRICERLYGIEIEAFCAWMSKVFLQLVFIEHLGDMGNDLPDVVCVADTMAEDMRLSSHFDLVVGNPPYGRVTLSPRLRRKYSRSLFGHANLYGVFTDMAVRMAKPNALIAYVTPTSFLGGKYFGNLRKLLREKAPPRAIDFVAHRNGVFVDVLQETCLAVYKKSRRSSRVSVHVTAPVGFASAAEVKNVGRFRVNGAADSPWVLPRDREHARLLRKSEEMELRLTDLGYEVSTGPLVWNRHKKQLARRPGEGNLPLIWAESVQSDGCFRFAHEKRNHVPYFHLLPGQDHLVTREPCVLVQRTTAKEQQRRIIAAQLPCGFVRRHGGVVVENHLNVVRPANGHPLLDLDTVVALLNSKAIDELFRCISGSVAVSAYEIESIPLPPEDELVGLQTLIRRRVSADRVQSYISSLYGISK